MQFLIKCLKYSIGFVSILLLIAIVRTFVIINLKVSVLRKCEKNETDGYIELSDHRWQRLLNALRYKTVSYTSHVYEKEQLAELVQYIKQEYPIIFNSEYVEHEVVNSYSLLIHVQGTNKFLTPYLLAAHLDVVPVLQEEWSFSAFGGESDDTYAYGRGTLDDKGSLIAQLNALEFLLERGIRPERSFFLAFGHDEEVRGLDGAREIAKTLRRKGIEKLHFVLDEGFMIFHGLIPGIKKDFAIIGVSEKGYLTLNMTVTSQGGHSSMPPPETAISILANAVSRLQASPMPCRFDSAIEEIFNVAAKHTNFFLSVVLSNSWLFKPLLKFVIASGRITQGLIRTTTAVTMINGGVKSNVIPSSAWAIVNHRVHPLDTVEEVIQYDKSVVADDRIKFEIVTSNDPHPISPFDPSTSLPYQVLTDTVHQIFDSAVTGPGIMIANTDTIHYLSFSKHVYRFFPVVVLAEDISRIHGKDERISRENFERVTNFYFHLMRNADRERLRSLTDYKGEL